MASRRCPLHLMRYPYTMVKEGGGCPVEQCTAKQESHPHLSPHSDWELKVGALNLLALGGYPPEPQAPEDPMLLEPLRLGPPPQFWLAQPELARCGYAYGKTKPFGLVRSLGRYYELQGWDNTQHRWWVEIVDPEWEMRNIPVLREEPERRYRDEPDVPEDGEPTPA